MITFTHSSHLEGTAMTVSMIKPQHAMAFIGTQNGGDHDLAVWGKIVRRDSVLVTIKVTTIRGASGRDYTPHLAGSIISIPEAITYLGFPRTGGGYIASTPADRI